MGLDDYNDEIDLVVGMYCDECRRCEGEPYTVIVSLAGKLELKISLPRNGSYPETSHPTLSVEAGPNQSIVTHYERQLITAVKETVSLGFPMLANIITVAQEMAAGVVAAQKERDTKKREEDERYENELLDYERLEEECSVHVWASSAISDRKSKFVAHMAYVQSIDSVLEVVMHLRRQRHIAVACHPTIYAYRFTDPETGAMHQDSEDDGETGASKRILFLMEQMKVDGYVVVVTRWFGGILLGPDRFKHIMAVAKEVLLTVPEREAERQRGAKSVAH